MLKNIFCIGGANIDCKLKSLEKLENETSNPVTLLKSYGGVARNIAENLAHWTQKIHLQTVVGNDREGHELLHYMNDLGVETHTCLTLSNSKTAHYYAILHPNGELHIALADMEIYDKTPFEQFTQSWCDWPKASIVFIDTNLPVSFIEYAMKESESNHHLLCIDPVSILKAKKIPSQMKGVFLLKPNHLEASLLSGMTINSLSDCKKAGLVLLKKGVKNVVISLGVSGYVLINEDCQKHFPSIKQDTVKDVNGAGDAFIAGILLGLQQNKTILHACQLGAAAASLTITSHQTVAGEISLKHLLGVIDTDKIKEDNENAILF